MELRAVRGRPVITVDNGERLGEIQDVFIDPQHRRVAILRIRRTSGDTNDVTFEDVHSIGADAVMLPSREVLRLAGDHSQALLDIDEFVRLRVVTEQGEARGTVDDAAFDPISGALTALVVSPAGIGGLLGRRQSVPIDQVRTIGRDVVVLIVPPPEAAEQEASSGDRGSAASAEAQ
ncbi:PRC-barrel domain-containing protein [Thermomicrobium sp. 4228-Ro]|uniref:PRC-barrel domain-containing protein n=1 Tax=Thermomicrobium sp. 4228-Ro TaxID=2993937 RepID=UPI0022488FAD|nr:PRC-barrel domain-containing protein [Thermomicrobium sp. 4228-Ro]MCX2727244.1 PRC-barrel domain-containing protein [Thermomicrobium sp. 4228-Ro]